MIGSEFGRYKVVERLGAGGMGEVYRAEDTPLAVVCVGALRVATSQGDSVPSP